jgi:Glycosyl hydrolase family 47
MDTGFNFTRSKDFSADTEKADAVVAAFKVGSVASPPGLFAKQTSQTACVGSIRLVTISTRGSVLTPLSAERDAMGDDEYHPIRKSGSNLTGSGVGYAIIDAIDTMQVMGLQDEYIRAREWISSKLSFESDGNFNTFEVSTRIYLNVPFWANIKPSKDHNSYPRWPSFSISPF